MPGGSGNLADSERQAWDNYTEKREMLSSHQE